MINDHKTQGKWKIQLTMSINFFSSEDSEEVRSMYNPSDNIEFMIGDETDGIIEKLSESFLERYQEKLEKSMKGSEFVFDSTDLLHYKLHKISLNKGGSYIDSPKWLQNKKATINPGNNDDKNNAERIAKIKPFIDQYDLNKKKIGIKKDWKKFESNNKSIAINILYIPYNTEEIRHAYKSKHDLKRENQLILLMNTDGKKWHYLAVKKLSALLKGVTK